MVHNIMTEILYSIIIPHYNLPLLLTKLLDSIPRSKEFEVIVVDDKSDKYLEEYAACKQKYSESNIRFYDNDSEKKSAGTCRNIGLLHATGKWILFADADDYFVENFLDILLKEKDREEDVIFFFPTSINIDSGEMADRHIEFSNILNAYLEEPTEENELVLRFHMVTPCCKMIRHSLITDNNIVFGTSKVANDVLFCRQLGVYADKIAVVRKEIYVITLREGSITYIMDSDQFLERTQVFVDSTVFVRNHVTPERYKKIGYNGRYLLHILRVNHLGMRAFWNMVWMFWKNGIRIW